MLQMLLKAAIKLGQIVDLLQEIRTKQWVAQSQHKQAFLKKSQTNFKQKNKLIQAKEGPKFFLEFWEIVAATTGWTRKTKSWLFLDF